MKILAMVLSGLLLLTGCSSESTDPAQAIKLLEYQKCLELQQSLTDSINKAISELFLGDFEKLVETFSNQAEPKEESGEIARFETHLKNCLPYRP